MANRQSTPGEVFSELLEDGEPQALAWVTGGAAVPTLSGLVKFYNTPYGGTLVEAELFGLPGKAQPGSSAFTACTSMKTGTAPTTFSTQAAISIPPESSTPSTWEICCLCSQTRAMPGSLSTTSASSSPRSWAKP